MQPCRLHTHITHVCRLCIYSGSIWYHINTLPQAGFDPPKQREDCYQSTTLPPSHHGWICEMIIKSFVFFTWMSQGNCSVGRNDLQASTLVGPTKENQVQDPDRLFLGIYKRVVFIFNT